MHILKFTRKTDFRLFAIHLQKNIDTFFKAVEQSGKINLLLAGHWKIRDDCKFQNRRCKLLQINCKIY